MVDRRTFHVGAWVRLAARYTCEWHCDCCLPGERNRVLLNGTLGRITDADDLTVTVLLDGTPHTLPSCSRGSLVLGTPTPAEEAAWLISQLSQ